MVPRANAILRFSMFTYFIEIQCAEVCMFFRPARLTLVPAAAGTTIPGQPATAQALFRLGALPVLVTCAYVRRRGVLWVSIIFHGFMIFRLILDIFVFVHQH